VKLAVFERGKKISDS